MFVTLPMEVDCTIKITRQHLSPLQHSSLDHFRFHTYIKYRNKNLTETNCTSRSDYNVSDLLASLNTKYFSLNRSIYEWMEISSFSTYIEGIKEYLPS